MNGQFRCPGTGVFYLVPFISLLLTIVGPSRMSSAIEPSKNLIPETLIYWAGITGTLQSVTSPDYAIIVEKSSQHLLLYKIHDDFSLHRRFACSTGKVKGPKLLSGDQKTPEGIYFFTQEHPEKYLSPTYGNRAFTTDYPNLLDRMNGKTGHSIWLHGTDKPLRNWDSNGCVVISNEDIDALSPFITLNRTPFIIVEDISFLPASTAARTVAGIRRLIENWTAAIEKGSVAAYLACYQKEHKPSLSWWPRWHRVRNNFRSSETPFSLSMENISVFKHRAGFVVLFDQILKVRDISMKVGFKKIYVTEYRKSYRIIGETYQSLAYKKTLKTTSHPLVGVGYYLIRKLTTEHKQSAEMKSCKIPLKRDRSS
ncbi:MAG: L,D-transpeptidase [Desulfobacteraceae bacterium]|nr:L,D-transpeptidase [Desulfobacteraceae bacterium]